MLRPVSDADRERDLRRLERDRRRRESGRSTYFDQIGTSFAGADLPTQETQVLRPDRLHTEPAGTDEFEPEALPPRRRLAVSGAIFGLSTALSRVLGLVREVVASYYFGAGGK